MAQRSILIFILLLVALRAEAYMARVVEIRDGHTIVIEHNGRQETVTLGGITTTDEIQARALLQWTLEHSWVLVESHDGAAFVYRSPDALFINRELVLRGYARATRNDIDPQPTAMVTYLGIVHPLDAPAAKPAGKAKTPKTPKTATGRSRTSNGTSPRSSRSRSPSSTAAPPSSTSPGSAPRP
jgi:hypothetical protein